MKTTKKQFEYFEKRVIYYARKLGITDYRFDVLLRDLPKDTLATANADLRGGVAQIKLNSESEYKYSNEELDQGAFHEVCEVLLGEVYCYLRVTYDNNLVEEMHHRIIRKLEKTVYPLLK
jgi:hypothetical protein